MHFGMLISTTHRHLTLQTVMGVAPLVEGTGPRIWESAVSSGPVKDL